MSRPELVLGALDLYDPDGSPYAIEVLADGTSRGNSSPVEVSMRSFIQNGSIVVTQGYENREVTLALAVSGSDLAALADGEAALFAELGKRNQLTWTPHDSYGAPTVFEVITSSLVQNDDDLAEIRSTPTRFYTVRLVCEPFAHSATETTVAALAASGTDTFSVDDMASATGWTAAVDGVAVTPTTASGKVIAQSTGAVSSAHTVALTRTGVIDTSATKYLWVDWKAGAGNVVVGFTASGDGLALTKVGSTPSPTAGYTRTTFYVAAASVSSLMFSMTSTNKVGSSESPQIRSLTLDQLSRSDIRPSIGTARQLLRSLTVGGSAPTTGSIAVQHATSALGDVLLYTCPADDSGYVPACRNYRVSGNGPTADATNTVSGYYDTISTATSTFDVPVSALPDGEYLVMARIDPEGGADGTTTVTWTHTPRMNAVDLATATTRVTTLSATQAPKNSYKFQRLGMVHLPLWDAALGETSINRFTVAATNDGGSAVRLDELYLFNLTAGRLTQVACGTAAPSAGGTSNRLWIDSPSLDNNGLGRYLRGYSADRSDAFAAHPAMVAQGIHEFEPPSIRAFSVATTPTTEVDIAFRYRKAWGTHAAE